MMPNYGIPGYQNPGMVVGADVPRVELKVDLSRGIRVLARFDKTMEVSNVRYEIPAGTQIEHTGQLFNGRYTVDLMTIPVVLTFNFRGRLCTVIGRASVRGSSLLVPTGCGGWL
jgi:hypothetical protein